MTKQSGLGARFFVGGYDLSGDIGSLGRMAMPRGVTEVTGIDKEAFERLHTFRDGAIDFNGYFNPDSNQAHPVLSALPTADVVGTYSLRSTIGSPAFSMVGKQVNYDPNRQQDGSLNFGTNMVANGYGAEWGTLLTAAPRTDTGATNGAGVGFDVGTAFVSLAGGAGEYVSTPDAAALDITGDIDIRVKVALDDWTPAAQNTVIAKWDNAGTQRSWQFGISTTGNPAYAWTADGSTSTSKNSGAATGFTDGTAHWIRVTHDVDNGAAGNTVRFYTSEDGVTWTQLGTDQVTAGTTSIFSGTALVELGAQGSGAANRTSGKIYEAVIMTGIGGTEVAHPIASLSGVTDATGKVWTVNGAAFLSIETTYGLQAYLQVGAFTGTDVTVKLQHSRDNSSWADVTGGGFTAVSASRTTQRIQTSRTLTIRRYIRAVTTTSGGFTSAAFIVQVVKNRQTKEF